MFADTVNVEVENIQDFQILSADHSYAQYQVVGFRHIQIYLTDHRPSSVMAAQEFLAGGSLDDFAAQINQPAYILVNQAGERGLMIDLYEAIERMPIQTFWAGICANNSLPLHNYYYYHYEPAGQGQVSFISIFQNDP